MTRIGQEQPRVGRAQFARQAYDGRTSFHRRGDTVTTRRRVLLLGSIGLLVAPRLGRGQPKSKTPRIGFVWGGSMGNPELMRERSAFLERLSALGYVEGKSIVIEERSSAVGRFRTWAC